MKAPFEVHPCPTQFCVGCNHVLTTDERRDLCDHCRIEVARARARERMRGHRAFLQSQDPLRRYFQDATRRIEGIYAQAGIPREPGAVIAILRRIEQSFAHRRDVQREVKKLICAALRDAQQSRSRRLVSQSHLTDNEPLVARQLALSERTAPCSVSRLRRPLLRMKGGSSW